MTIESFVWVRSGVCRRHSNFSRPHTKMNERNDEKKKNKGKQQNGFGSRHWATISLNTYT